MKEYLKINNVKYKFNGITLISLVITIVILIILASVAVYLSLGNNGIFTRAKQAKETTNKQESTDIVNLKITTAQMNKYAERQEMPTLQELADILYEDNEIQYVALESKVADKEKVTVGEKTSIFTKLNQYPYEFEINSSLQLASIDGEKLIADVTPTMPVRSYIHYNGLGNIEGDEYTFTESYPKVYVFLTESDSVGDVERANIELFSGTGTISKIAGNISGGHSNYYLNWALFELTNVIEGTTLKIQGGCGFARTYCIFI